MVPKYQANNVRRQWLVAFVFVVAWVPVSALAFGTKTHVLIGHEVVKSLRSCSSLRFDHCVYIHLEDGSKKRVRVRSPIATAILENKEMFLLGQYGPGVFTAAPGTGVQDMDRFGLERWTKRLLEQAESGPEVAFSYGFSSHVAADVFAQTYVNQYVNSGFGGEGFHAQLEALISAHTPEVAGGSYRFMKNALESGVPYAFIVDQLYTKNDETVNAVPGAGVAHAPLPFDAIDKAFEHALQQIPLNQSKIDPDKIHSEMLAQAGHYPFSQFLEDYGPVLKSAGLVQQVEVYAEAYLAAKQKLVYQSGEGLAPVFALVGQLSAGPDDPTTALTQIVQVGKKWASAEGGQVAETLPLAGSLRRDLAEAEQALLALDKAQLAREEARRKVQALEATASFEPYEACMTPCDRLPDAVTRKYRCEKIEKVEKEKEIMCTRPGEYFVCPTEDNPLKLCLKNVTYVCDVIQYIEETRVESMCTKSLENVEKAVCRQSCGPLRAEAETAQSSLQSAVLLEGEREELLQVTQQAVVNAHEKVMALVEQIHSYQASVAEQARGQDQDEVAQVKNWSAAFRQHVEQQRARVQKVSKTYVKANVDALTNTMDRSLKDEAAGGRSSFAQPYQTWLACYGRIFAYEGTSPLSAPADHCEADSLMNEIAALANHWEQLAEEPTSRLGAAITARGPYPLIAGVQERLDRFAKALEAESVVPKPRVNNVFKVSHRSRDKVVRTGNKNWFQTGRLESIADRVKYDMILNGQPTFNPADFSVVANGIQLAKLSLLDEKALSHLFKTMAKNGEKVYFSGKKHQAEVSPLQAGRDKTPAGEPVPTRIAASSRDVSTNASTKGAERDYSYDYVAKQTSGQSDQPERFDLSIVYSFLDNFLDQLRVDSQLRLYKNPDMMDKVFNNLFDSALSPALLGFEAETGKVNREPRYEPSHQAVFPKLDVLKIGSP
ncbi:MAG: hypothetical protein MJA28_15305 [Gammaproteobacteria bacterium]|nr:hypothetical protein [Gammaproteobacteria bacterium]